MNVLRGVDDLDTSGGGFTGGLGAHLSSGLFCLLLISLIFRPHSRLSLDNLSELEVVTVAEGVIALAQCPGT
jgi:hypothetical protein